MAVIDVKCPKCKETNVIKFGTNTTGKQRYKCKLVMGIFQKIKQKIIDMALNGSGIRETARVLGVSMNTVISELKKKAAFTVNQALLVEQQSI